MWLIGCLLQQTGWRQKNKRLDLCYLPIKTKVCLRLQNVKSSIISTSIISESIGERKQHREDRENIILVGGKGEPGDLQHQLSPCKVPGSNSNPAAVNACWVTVELCKLAHAPGWPEISGMSWWWGTWRWAKEAKSQPSSVKGCQDECRQSRGREEEWKGV